MPFFIASNEKYLSIEVILSKWIVDKTIIIAAAAVGVKA
jgi:hypothetical protein